MTTLLTWSQRCRKRASVKKIVRISKSVIGNERVRFTVLILHSLLQMGITFVIKVFEYVVFYYRRMLSNLSLFT